jgi:hypothetical protein
MTIENQRDFIIIDPDTRIQAKKKGSSATLPIDQYDYLVSYQPTAWPSFLWSEPPR